MSELNKKEVEAWKDEMKSALSHLEQRVEEWMELYRQGEDDQRPQGLDGSTPGLPQYSPGSVMVGVPKFFDFNHLLQVDRTYSGIEDHWMRGRLTMWNAQMRFAQLANDRESACLFMMLQLEALTQLILPKLYLENNRAKREFTLDGVFNPVMKKSNRSIKIAKGEGLDIVPHMQFGILTSVSAQEGVYVKILSSMMPDDSSGKYRDRVDGKYDDLYATILKVEASGLDRVANIYQEGIYVDDFISSEFTVILTAAVDWNRLDWLQGQWLWVSRDSIAEFRGDVVELDKSSTSNGLHYPQGRVAKIPLGKALRTFEKKYWKLILPAPHALSVVPSGWEKFPFKARYKVPGMPAGWDEFMLYADKEWVLGAGSAAPMEVQLRYDFSGSEPELKREAGAISVLAGRVNQKNGAVHDVMGQFGQSTSSIAQRMLLMMQVSPDGVDDSGWGEGGDALGTFHAIKNMRNNLVHGNLGKMKSAAAALSMEEISTFWDIEVVPRMSHWMHEV